MCKLVISVLKSEVTSITINKYVIIVMYKANTV